MDLSQAAGKGDLETIRALLDAEADIRYLKPRALLKAEVRYGMLLL